MLQVFFKIHRSMNWSTLTTILNSFILAQADHQTLGPNSWGYHSLRRLPITGWFRIWPDNFALPLVFIFISWKGGWLDLALVLCLGWHLLFSSEDLSWFLLSWWELDFDDNGGIDHADDHGEVEEGGDKMGWMWNQNWWWYNLWLPGLYAQCQCWENLIWSWRQKW